MTGAHGELYDYLAEEVVGDLDDETQHFLMTTSLLQAVDPTLVEIVGGFPRLDPRSSSRPPSGSASCRVAGPAGVGRAGTTRWCANSSRRACAGPRATASPATSIDP